MSSESPAILNMPDFDASTKSVCIDSLNIPMDDVDGSVKSNSSKTVAFWKKLLGFILLLILVGLISAVVGLSLKAQYLANLTGNYCLTMPILGQVNGSFELQDKSQISLSSKLSILQPSSPLWNQTYVDLQV